MLVQDSVVASLPNQGSVEPVILVVGGDKQTFFGSVSHNELASLQRLAGRRG
jgi:hypothetical protein